MTFHLIDMTNDVIPGNGNNDNGDAPVYGIGLSVNRIPGPYCRSCCNMTSCLYYNDSDEQTAEPSVISIEDASCPDFGV